MSRPWRNARRWVNKFALTLLPIAITLLGCAPNTPIPQSDCLTFQAITPTAADWKIISPHLSAQIIQHDAVWDRLCSEHPVGRP